MIVIHVPLWNSRRNETVKRLYLRFEFHFFETWASGGRNQDGSLKKYIKGYRFDSHYGVSHGKVTYSHLHSE